jgi:nitric oxide reductase subunit B
MFVALVAIVVASLLGEAAAIQGYISLKGPWFWIGNQGWEYFDLGRLWQILLIIGMALWLVIVARGIWPGLRGEHLGNMPYRFLYSALSLPLFYAQPLVRALEWARLPADVLFIVVGILPIVYLALRTFCWRNRPTTVRWL